MNGQQEIHDCITLAASESEPARITRIGSRWYKLLGLAICDVLLQQRLEEDDRAEVELLRREIESLEAELGIAPK